MIARTIAGLVLTEIPVTPDAPEARQWLRDELAKPPYTAAKPTWFDRMSQAILDWLDSLTAPQADGAVDWLPLVATIIIVAIIVAAFLIFGLPRLNRRSTLTAELFGEEDRRSADDMRRAAAAAAAHGDWNLACAESFRALARGLTERTVLSVTPGTTAHEVASRAAATFPPERARLLAAAEVFDGVRYLGRAGTADGYLAVSSLEADLRRARPATLQGVVAQ